MAQSKKKSFSIEEIAAGVEMQKGADFKVLVQTIATLEQEKSVIFTKKGKIKLPQKEVLLEGIFRRNERGFGFVNVDPEGDDIYIANKPDGVIANIFREINANYSKTYTKLTSHFDSILNKNKQDDYNFYHGGLC